MPNSSGSLIANAAAIARPTATTASLPDSDPASASGEATSCFQSRSEYSRANSRDNESRSPMRFTATRNASSSARPASLSAPI